jgi:hypothetical protein
VLNPPPHPVKSNSDPTNRKRFMPLPWLRTPFSIIKELTFRFKHETHGCSVGRGKAGLGIDKMFPVEHFVLAKWYVQMYPYICK